MDDTAERLVRVETKLDSLITLNDTRINHIEQRVVSMEAAHRWLNRLIVGAVAVAVLGLVVMKPEVRPLSSPAEQSASPMRPTASPSNPPH